MTTSTLLPNHLVVVCGHGIWQGGPAHGYDESEWLIESYKAGETPTFIEHIKAGIQALVDDERALVAFSGGPTRKETPLSEARSYANLAAANDYFGLLPLSTASTPPPQSHELSPIPLHHRILVEEQALDSYYNILFSLIVFWRRVGTWPAHLTIVSHAFKRSRLVDDHCGPGAIEFLPLDQRVSFIGINPPNLPAEFGGPSVASGTAVSEDKNKAMQGAHDVISHWAVDPHGVGDLLAGKRRARNPWNCSQKLFVSNEERQRSGLLARQVGGDMEAIAENSPRPWNKDVQS
ncbi:hypothetical protein SEUCBS139899_004029 [Sporothrix eucalyptigena]|uniref:DUF218 domain-containing protein n=1 Tax=Sporothrix eucalyptigena TaxID=1812306 RepID=A0ABP0AMP8_9PEZI